MKKRLSLFSILLMLSFASLTSAKNLRYTNLLEAANWSTLPKSAPTSISLNNLPYKNILEVSKWSKLTNGRALTTTLRKRNAHGLNVQDPDPEALFAIGAGGGGRCNWGCCFRTCVGSAVGANIGTFCLGVCIGCADTPTAPVSCPICAVCVGASAMVVEFCALHCCVDPGC